MKINLPVRRLIPKWRPTASTLNAPDAASFTKNKITLPTGSVQEFEQVLRLWKETSDPGVMGDLLAFSIYPEFSVEVYKLGYDALQAGQALTSVQARFIRELAKTHEQPIHALISTSVQEDALWLPFQKPISQLRELLRTDQKNPLALLDYAQLQAAIGKIDAAKRAIRTALMLAPNNRIVLRTAARFFVHAGDPDHAHSIIKKHPRTQLDPWLMASEIAIADINSRGSMMAAKGRRFLLDNKAMPAEHLTELAGAIAMRELATGNMKLAREAQRRALISPNDNVVAQAIDMQKSFGVDLQSSAIQKAILKSSEAQVLQALTYGSPTDALKSAVDWHNEEPYSSRPVQVITYLLAYQNNLDLAQRWLAAGLLADPADKGLLINLAFVQTRREDYTAALRTIKRLRTNDPKGAEPFALATEGLTKYQQGIFDAGDSLYQQAMGIFVKQNEFHAAAFCKLNQTLFAQDYKHPKIEYLIAEAKDMLDRYGSPDCDMVLKIRRESRIKASKIEPEATRRLSQWVFNPTTNTLTERIGVTAVGASRLIVLPKQNKRN